MAATDAHATMEELLEAVFSVRSVPRLYKEEQLQLQESTAGVQLKKKSGRGSQGARRQDELIGGKPPVVK
jgi:hypothetical protein